MVILGETSVFFGQDFSEQLLDPQEAQKISCWNEKLRSGRCYFYNIEDKVESVYGCDHQEDGTGDKSETVRA